MMETRTAYLTRRARQERTTAIEATSAEARAAHLEMAVRLARAATEPALWQEWSAQTEGPTFSQQLIRRAAAKVACALAAAFPLRPIVEFECLLEQIH